MRRKEDSRKLFEFVPHLEWPAFELFFERFTRYAKRTEGAMNFGMVKTAFGYKFEVKHQKKQYVLR